jgi:alkylhydroperoxidase/carboxymuconolactone decarboxylase family protein YurZ
MNDTQTAPSGLWDDAAWQELQQWDAGFAAAYGRMTALSLSPGVLTPKFAEFVGIAISAACTSLNSKATRRHITRAIAVGATRDEVLFVIKCASVMSIHSMSLGAPILLEEAKAASATLPAPADVSTPACDAMRAAGQWNAAWDPFLALDPEWTDAFMASGISIYGSGVLPPKEVELLSIAFDASFTHMYAPGTRRHIRNALAAGATVVEIMAVLKLCVAHGVQACNQAVPLLDEALEEADH